MLRAEYRTIATVLGQLKTKIRTAQKRAGKKGRRGRCRYQMKNNMHEATQVAQDRKA